MFQELQDSVSPAYEVAQYPIENEQKKVELVRQMSNKYVYSEVCRGYVSVCGEGLRQCMDHGLALCEKDYMKLFFFSMGRPPMLFL